jgi:hypothetical protein
VTITAFAAVSSKLFADTISELPTPPELNAPLTVTSLNVTSSVVFKVWSKPAPPPANL